MKKSVLDKDVFYTIVWSPVYPYEKYSAWSKLPELAGIVCLLGKVPRGEPEYLIFYGCWRDGLRVGLKNFLDPLMTKFPEILEEMNGYDLLFKYAVLDKSPLDVKDIMYWLIKNYKPAFNNMEQFRDSRRYRDIYVKEMTKTEKEITKHIPGFGL